MVHGGSTNIFDCDYSQKFVVGSNTLVDLGLAKGPWLVVDILILIWLVDRSSTNFDVKLAKSPCLTAKY